MLYHLAMADSSSPGSRWVIDGDSDAKAGIDWHTREGALDSTVANEGSPEHTERDFPWLPSTRFIPLVLIVGWVAVSEVAQWVIGAILVVLAVVLAVVLPVVGFRAFLVWFLRPFVQMIKRG